MVQVKTEWTRMWKVLIYTLEALFPHFFCKLTDGEF